MSYPTIEEAKEKVNSTDRTSVEIAEEHHCGTNLMLSEDKEEYGGGYVLLCPECLDRAGKV